MEKNGFSIRGHFSSVSTRKVTKVLIVKERTSGGEETKPTDLDCCKCSHIFSALANNVWSHLKFFYWESFSKYNLNFQVFVLKNIKLECCNCNIIFYIIYYFLFEYN